METVLSYVTELDFEKISEYDLVLVGSPNHIGRPTRSVKKLIDKLGELDLKEKRIAVFDTYMSKDFEKAVKKMEKRIGKKIPGSDGSPKSVEGKVKKRCAAPEHNPRLGGLWRGFFGILDSELPIRIQVSKILGSRLNVEQAELMSS